MKLGRAKAVGCATGLGIKCNNKVDSKAKAIGREIPTRINDLGKRSRYTKSRVVV